MEVSNQSCYGSSTIKHYIIIDFDNCNLCVSWVVGAQAFFSFITCEYNYIIVFNIYVKIRFTLNRSPIESNYQGAAIHKEPFFCLIGKHFL